MKQGLRKGELYHLDPAKFFLTDEGLDYTLVAVGPRMSGDMELDSYGTAPLIEATGKILLGQAIQIIQHPSGGPKKYAVKNNRLADILDRFLHYTTDTLRGSSGSPAFNAHWEVVALHHSGVGPLNANGDVVTKDGRIYDPESMSDDEVEWIANEGVRASVIVAALKEALPRLSADRGKLLQTVLAETADPLAGSVPVPEFHLPESSNLMSQNIFNFSGPVTILIGSQTTSVKAPEPTPDPAPTRAERETVESIAPDYSTRDGYQPQFLGKDLALPAIESDGLAAKASPELKYQHFSIVMRKDRRLALYTAVNIDGATAKRPSRNSDKWIFDPRLGKEFQLGEFLYKNNALDRGHLVRRLDPTWGTTRIAKIANDDTFHFTNCSPQHELLNQGIWNDLEDYLLDNADQDNVRLTVFTGPVFQDDDPVYRGVALPRRFWKVAVMTRNHGNDFLAAGFVQSQARWIDGLREAEFLAQEVRTDQVRVATIEEFTGLKFHLPESADALAADQTNETLRGVAVRRLSRLEDIRLR
jgi:endonuclease G